MKYRAKKILQCILPLSYSFSHFNIEIKHTFLLTFQIKVTCLVEIAFFIALLIFCNLEIFVSQSTFLSSSSVSALLFLIRLSLAQKLQFN